MSSSSFIDHVLDLLIGVGPVKARAMFGGHGLSLGGVSIGLISDDVLFLRVDEATRSKFEAAGSRVFVYPSKNGPMAMKNYWALPEEAIDDPDRAVVWGRLAAQAAQRAEAVKSAKKKPAAKKTARPKR